jgi:V/A-type H+-transporting ATPase subunit D
MPEAAGNVLATRVAFLELQDERRLVQEGYALLDEKRMMLATEILKQLRIHSELDKRIQGHSQHAREALEAAVGEHGFDDLTVEPPCPLESALIQREGWRFLGLELQTAELGRGAVEPWAPSLNPTPESRDCAEAFRDLVLDHTAAASCARNLRLLTDDYVRTERRARALEKVLMPEIDESLQFIEEQLDALDQEEALRVRMASQSAD